jgi:hypothetical protein
MPLTIKAQINKLVVRDRLDFHGTWEKRRNTIFSVKDLNFFWDIAPYSPLKINRRLGWTFRLRFQGLSVSKICLLSGLQSFHASFIVWLRRWRRHVPLKRQLTLKRLHVVTYQKIKLFKNLTGKPRGKDHLKDLEERWSVFSEESVLKM